MTTDTIEIDVWDAFSKFIFVVFAKCGGFLNWVSMNTWDYKWTVLGTVVFLGLFCSLVHWLVKTKEVNKTKLWRTGMTWWEMAGRGYTEMEYRKGSYTLYIAIKGTFKVVWGLLSAFFNMFLCVFFSIFTKLEKVDDNQVPSNPSATAGNAAHGSAGTAQAGTGGVSGAAGSGQTGTGNNPSYQEFLAIKEQQNAQNAFTVPHALPVQNSPEFVAMLNQNQALNARIQVLENTLRQMPVVPVTSHFAGQETMRQIPVGPNPAAFAGQDVLQVTSPHVQAMMQAMTDTVVQVLKKQLSDAGVAIPTSFVQDDGQGYGDDSVAGGGGGAAPKKRSK